MQSPDMNGFPALPPPSINGFPNFPNPTIKNGSDLMAIPQVTPTPNKKAVIGQTPDSPFSFGDNPIGANPVPTPSKNVTRNTPIRRYPSGKSKVIKGSPSKLPDLSGTETAENKPDEKPVEVNPPIIGSEAVKDFKPNKQPFEKLGDSVNASLAKKEVDLNKPFLVVMEGVITDDGKLDSTKSKFIKTEGDKKMSEVARQAIEAVGDSGFLFFLKESGVDKVNFTLVQDDKQMNVIIVSEQRDLNKARTTASTLNALLSGLKIADANGFKKLDENSKVLIENSKITSDGKNFVLNFALPKQTAQDIITKTLKDRAEKRAAQQPKSSADVNSNSKTALAK